MIVFLALALICVIVLMANDVQFIVNHDRLYRSKSTETFIKLLGWIFIFSYIIGTLIENI